MNKLYFNQRLSRRNVTPITDETINRLVKTHLFESNRKLNSKLYSLHQYLLRYAMYKNKSCEVGILWNYLDDEYIIIKGTENGINVHDKAVHMLHNGIANSLVFMHHHPKNSIFSYRDLHSFCSEDSIIAMTAVCNDGRIHTLRKEWGFNSDAVEIAYDNALDQKKSGIKEILKNAKKLKLMYRCSVPRRRR